VTADLRARLVAAIYDADTYGAVPTREHRELLHLLLAELDRLTAERDAAYRRGVEAAGPHARAV